MKKLITLALLSIFALVINVIPAQSQDVEPAGTVFLAMRSANYGKTYLGGSVYIDSDNNFVGARFVSLGRVSGLRGITYVPGEGWTNKVAAIPGTGIVAYVGSQYYRIYVVDEILRTEDRGVIGFNIRYQTPFKVSDAAFELSTQQVTFGAYGGSVKVYYRSQDVMQVNASDSNDWLTLSTHKYDGPGWDGYYLLEATGNGSTSSRYATVTARDKVSGKTITIQITQSEASGQFYLYQRKAEFDHKRQRLRISMSTNVSYSLEQDGDWFSFSKYDQELTVQENKTGQTRQGHLIFTALESTVRDTLTIIQKAAPLSVSRNLFNINRKGYNLKSTIETNAGSWTARANAEWCSCSFYEKDLTIRVDANGSGQDRTAIVTVTLDNGATTDITIHQGKYAPADLYDENGVKGVVFEVSGFHGKIFSLHTGRIFPMSTEWVRIGTSDFNDGEKNMQVIKRIDNWQSYYPAAAWCDTYGSPAGNSGWYLPAYHEMETIWKNREAYNEILVETKGADQFEYNIYGKGKIKKYLGKALTDKYYDSHKSAYLYYITSTEYDNEIDLVRPLGRSHIIGGDYDILTKKGPDFYIYAFHGYNANPYIIYKTFYRPASVVRAVRKF